MGTETKTKNEWIMISYEQFDMFEPFSNSYVLIIRLLNMKFYFISFKRIIFMRN